MAPETNGKPHQDPVQPKRPPSDGLAAAQQDIDELHKRVAQVAEATGLGDGLLRQKIDELERNVVHIAGEVKMAHSRMDSIVIEIETRPAELAGQVQRLETLVGEVMDRITKKLEGPHGE